MLHACRLLLAAVVAGLLAACANGPAPAERTADLLRDRLFGAPSERIDVDTVFDLNDAMRDYADSRLAQGAQRTDPRKGLVDALYQGRQLALRYDAARTRNAAEAFEQRAGNCLSLVIMTAAFAKHLGLAVGYQSVQVEELFTREGNLTFANGHVNLVLKRLPQRMHEFGDSDRDLTVDFLPAAELRGARVQALQEETVLAMYLNNRAAEALAAGQLNDAYAWARAAVLRDPAFLASANTLAVVYQRAGHAREAEAALRHVLARDPDNTSALSNLVPLLRGDGRDAEADRVAAHLADVQPYPPFHFLDIGRQAMARGEWSRARDAFARELRRQPHQHEVHFWAAQALLRLGDTRGAIEHMRKARDFSTTMATQGLYEAKLARLRELQLQ